MKSGLLNLAGRLLNPIESGLYKQLGLEIVDQ